MELKKDKKYRFIIGVGNKTLSFTGVVISIDDNFVTFLDKFDKTLTYNLNNIISVEELLE